MSINFNLPVQDQALTPRITVIGIGGAGGNAVNNMIECGLEGIDFVASNTDAQALEQSVAPRKIQLGPSLTQGLGAGSRPDIGRAAAEEVIDSLIEQLTGVNMVFLAAGMGGGTGTGAAPVIARAAREQDILTVGVVTKPFNFEGITRMRTAEQGIEELQQFVDTLIVIPNQNLFRVANEKTTFAEAFSMADDVLQAGVRGITDLMVKPGLINLDFADIRAVMAEMGKAQMGTGECEGENRAVRAAEAAISNPILEDSSMKGAHGVLINITGGTDITMFEVDEAANRIKEEVDAEANIIFGAAIDESLSGSIRVSMVATGIDAEASAADPSHQKARPRPVLVASSSSAGDGNSGHIAARTQVGEAEEEDARDAIVAAVADQKIAAQGGGSGLHMHASSVQASGIQTSGVQASKTATAGETGEMAQNTAPPASPALAQVSARKEPVQPDYNLSFEDTAESPKAEKQAAPEGLLRRMTLGRVKNRPKAPTPESLPMPQQSTRSHNEDLLEIPAFLRRQAN